MNNVHHTLSQERKNRHETFLAKLSPHPTLRPECIRTKSTPDPPRLWYGLALSPDTYRDYVVKKGNPDGLDLTCDSLLMTHPAMDLLREACKTELICDLRPLYPYSEELNRVVCLKSNSWASARHTPTEEDKKLADMLRKELDLPADHPCLWYFDYATADRAFTVRLPISPRIT